MAVRGRLIILSEIYLMDIDTFLDDYLEKVSDACNTSGLTEKHGEYAFQLMSAALIPANEEEIPANEEEERLITYKKVFGNSVEYGKYEASKMLESIRNEHKWFNLRSNALINLMETLKIEKIDMTPEERKARHKLIMRIQELENIRQGKTTREIDEVYFEALQDCEFTR